MFGIRSTIARLPPPALGDAGTDGTTPDAEAVTPSPDLRADALSMLARLLASPRGKPILPAMLTDDQLIVISGLRPEAVIEEARGIARDQGIERYALFYEDGEGVVLRCRDGDGEEVERVPAAPVADR
jgi:hypothetical protein